jgi:hypothetical protein
LVGSPWHGGGRQLGAAREESVALGQFGEEEGHPPPSRGPVGPHGPRRLTDRLGQKPGKNSFEFK